jgi:membrane associated rhomboid family serine protease
MPTCYRHPRVETGVSCSNCGRPICPECMTPTPVGMRCPECARQRTPVRTIRTMHADPTVTYALIVLNVLVFVGMSAGGSSLTGGGSGSVFNDLYLSGPSVAGGDWWRLITSGFMHAGLFHIGFNMYALLWLGRMLEPAIGHLRFAALYFASLLCGSFGVILLSPNSATVGASGAIFGLFGALVVMHRAQGISLMQSGLGPVLILNLAFTLLIPGISIGGHLGGFAGGLLAGWAMERLARRRAGELPAVAAGVALAVAAGVLAVVVAGSQGAI